MFISGVGHSSTHYRGGWLGLLSESDADNDGLWRSLRNSQSTPSTFLISHFQEENVEFNIVYLAILFHFREGAYYEIFAFLTPSPWILWTLCHQNFSQQPT